MISPLSAIDKSWSLFLDRDGVINCRLVDDYVKSPDEFEFLPCVLEAIRLLSVSFGHIIIVSNQQGVGKGLMTVQEVDRIHDVMLKKIEKAGGKVNAVFFSPNLESENNSMRKPGTGMALKAKERFPAIDFQRSVMAGDSASDMIFGRNAGMTTVFIGSSLASIDPPNLVDLHYPDLVSFAHALSSYFQQA